MYVTDNNYSSFPCFFRKHLKEKYAHFLPTNINFISVTKEKSNNFKRTSPTDKDNNIYIYIYIYIYIFTLCYFSKHLLKKKGALLCA